MKTELKLWTHPKSYFGSTWEGWYVGLGRNRDSSSLENSNFDVFLQEVRNASAQLSVLHPNIGPYGREAMEIDSVYVVRESHWLCGWVEWIAVHQSDEGAVNRALGLFQCLDVHPVLDEDHWGALQDTLVHEYWNSLTISDRVDLCATHECSIFSARHDYPPEEIYDYLHYDI